MVSGDFDDITPLKKEVFVGSEIFAEEDGGGFGLVEAVDEQRLVTGEI